MIPSKRNAIVVAIMKPVAKNLMTASVLRSLLWNNPWTIPMKKDISVRNQLSYRLQRWDNISTLLRTYQAQQNFDRKLGVIYKNRPM
jgi:hypothetical protein